MATIRCREGEYAKNRIPVTGGVYGIPERLKELRDSLFVMYETTCGVYEVHDASQDDCTLACELPYEELDARALLYVREHMRERFEELVAEIDRHNAKLEDAALNEHMDKAGYKMRQAIRYLDQHESADSLPKELIEE